MLRSWTKHVKTKHNFREYLSISLQGNTVKSADMLSLLLPLTQCLQNGRLFIGLFCLQKHIHAFVILKFQLDLGIDGRTTVNIAEPLSFALTMFG